MKTKQGNVHKTYIRTNDVIQKLNSIFIVPKKEDVNKIANYLKQAGLEVPIVIKQNRKQRILTKLRGNFYDKFNTELCISGMVFLSRLHKLLKDVEIIRQFKPVSEFSQGMKLRTIWGDTNTSNFLVNINLINKREMVNGIVDYDTISLGSHSYDVFMALVSFPKNHTYKVWDTMLEAYGCEHCKENKKSLLQKYILIKIKEISTHGFGLGYFGSKPKKYYKQRIKELNNLYDKSLVWGSV